MTVTRVHAVAPGRVNLIGDHTDYMGGLAMPMAVQLETSVTAVLGGSMIELRSDAIPGRVDIALPIRDASAVEPAWGRYVAGVAQELGAAIGMRGEVRSSVPAGSGLSSSAALAVACALALGDTGTPLQVAERCQRAEHLATGVPCGIMDQLAITAGVEGHALVIDCATLQVTPVPVPDSAVFWVVHSGQHRQLVGSAYAERRQQCERAEHLIGRLPSASRAEIDSLTDPLLRRRARHVRTECDRVEAFAASLAAADVVRCGELMTASHESLRGDFEVSTPELDRVVESLRSTPGVHGARLTGAGFGGCVVALADPAVVLAGWRVTPSAGARVEFSN